MCLAVYIASDLELPLVQWDKAAPSIHVSEEVRKLKQFKLTNVRYVGSHEGCGCGFLKDGEVGDELHIVQENYEKLAAYITRIHQNSGSVEIFSCWEGGQDDPPEFVETITVSDLTQADFEFKEQALYRLKA